jgi:hypothetical protein
MGKGLLLQKRTTFCLPALLRGRTMKIGTGLIGIFLALPAAAQTPRILQPKAGDVVSSPVTIVVNPDAPVIPAGAMDGMPGMEPMAAGHHGAHIHILIDAPPPAPGKPIPMDRNHLHLMHGETSKTVSLPPGHHRIQLLVGTVAHQAGGTPSLSAPVDFTVR